MRKLLSSLRFWIPLFIGGPLLILGMGAGIYFALGKESPIWNIISTIGPAASLLATMSLAIAALIGLITNIRLVSEMEKTRKSQTTASIIAYFDNPMSNLLDLVVKNIGYGTAKEMGLKISPSLLDHADRDINELSLFKSGIKFFPPNREFRQIVGTSSQFFDENSKRPLEYKLTISYRDVEGDVVHEEIIPLDLSVYRNLPIHRESDIVKAIKEVKSALEAILRK